MPKKNTPPDQFNPLVVAAKAIGSRLGKLAIAAHLAIPDPEPVKKLSARKRPTAKKAAKRKLAPQRVSKHAGKSALAGLSKSRKAAAKPAPKEGE